jgi:hypothetical protein
VNVNGREVIRDDDWDHWFLDPDINPSPQDRRTILNTEPLLVNHEDTLRLRPDAVTKIANFFLASDYVRTHTDLATMEAANEAARRAVNGILEASGSGASRCEVWPLHEPEMLEPFQAYDREFRWKQGLPYDTRIVGGLHWVLELLRNVNRILPAMHGPFTPLETAGSAAKGSTGSAVAPFDMNQVSRLSDFALAALRGRSSAAPAAGEVAPDAASPHAATAGARPRHRRLRIVST